MEERAIEMIEGSFGRRVASDFCGLRHLDAYLAEDSHKAAAGNSRDVVLRDPIAFEHNFDGLSRQGEMFAGRWHVVQAEHGHTKDTCVGAAMIKK